MNKIILYLINLFLALIIVAICYLVYHLILDRKALLSNEGFNTLKTSKNQLQLISNTTQYNKSNIDELHKKIYQYIESNPNIKNKQQISLQSTHPDYRDIIKLLASGKSNKNSISTTKFKDDKYILQTLSSNYKISLKNIYNYKYDFIKETSNKKYLFTFTGAYTSSFKRPVGIFSINGKILNPAIRNWSGILLIKDGVAQIIDANNINIGFKKLNILKSIEDLKLFFNWIRKHNLSVLQSHMIINNGKVAVKKKRDKFFRRRVIFEDEEGILHVYDSRNKKITLLELSNILVTKYKAQKAINLDMGTYDYAYKYIDGTTMKLGLLDKITVLSNVIEIEGK
jgi:hypothetical protein